MRNYTVQEAKEYAEQVSKTVVIRGYNNAGESYNKKRISTEEEAKKIKIAIYSALLAIRLEIREDEAFVESAIRTAEYFLIADEAFENIKSCKERIDGYVSVRQPLYSFLNSKE